MKMLPFGLSILLLSFLRGAAGAGSVSCSSNIDATFAAATCECKAPGGCSNPTPKGVLCSNTCRTACCANCKACNPFDTTCLRGRRTVEDEAKPLLCSTPCFCYGECIDDGDTASLNITDFGECSKDCNEKCSSGVLASLFTSLDGTL
jgi:hypothetical protein